MKPVIVEILPDIAYPICIDFEEENSVVVDVLEEEALVIAIKI